jgi:hypothetical protein
MGLTETEPIHTTGTAPVRLGCEEGTQARSLLAKAGHREATTRLRLNLERAGTFLSGFGKSTQAEAGKCEIEL